MKSLLVERRQWEILIAELPVVVRAADEDGPVDAAALPPAKGWGKAVRRVLTGARWMWARNRTLRRGTLPRAIAAVRAQGLEPLRDQKGMEKLLERYRVGEETITDDVGTSRFTELAATVLLLVWNVVWDVVRKTRAGSAVRPVGWLVRGVYLIALTIARAPRWATAVLPVAAVVSLYLAVTGPDLLLGSRVAMWVVTLAIWGVLFYWWRLHRVLLWVAAGSLVAWAAFGVPGTFTARVDFGEQPISLGPLDLRWPGAFPLGPLDLRWPAAVAALIVALMVFRLIPQARRWWVPWTSGALGAAVAAASLLPSRQAAPGWAWALGVIVAVGMPPTLERLLERRRGT